MVSANVVLLAFLAKEGYQDTLVDAVGGEIDRRKNMRGYSSIRMRFHGPVLLGRLVVVPVSHVQNPSWILHSVGQCLVVAPTLLHPATFRTDSPRFASIRTLRRGALAGDCVWNTHTYVSRS